MDKDRKYKLVAQNKKAYHDYFIEETYRAGIELFGTEVKSLRQGKCNIKDSYIAIRSAQAFVIGLHISPYEHGNIFNKNPLRDRRLLLNKVEINKLQNSITRDGYTVVPVKVYFSGSYAKLDIAVAKGKKLYDKRHDIAKKDQRREHEREYKIKNL
jgi:SsrA-binding protein